MFQNLAYQQKKLSHYDYRLEEMTLIVPTMIFKILDPA